MARTYRTLSLSLPPGIFKKLAMMGKKTDRTGARVAAEIVLREIAKTPASKEARRTSSKKTRRKSWCCQARVTPVQGPLVMPENGLGARRWVQVIALLCSTCKKQMHGREYEGWIADV